MNDKLKPKRKPGGQPYNRNAWKHGLRSRGATPLELEQERVHLSLLALAEAAKMLIDQWDELQRQRSCGFTKPFVGTRTKISFAGSPGCERGFRPFVSVERSPEHGLIVVTARIDVPTVNLSFDLTHSLDSIREIASFTHSANDSPSSEGWEDCQLTVNPPPVAFLPLCIA